MCHFFSVAEQQAAPASASDLTPFKEVDPISDWYSRYEQSATKP
jgi:hypothetical protein